MATCTEQQTCSASWVSTEDQNPTDQSAGRGSNTDSHTTECQATTVHSGSFLQMHLQLCVFDYEIGTRKKPTYRSAWWSSSSHLLPRSFLSESSIIVIHRRFCLLFFLSLSGRIMVHSSLAVGLLPFRWFSQQLIERTWVDLARWCNTPEAD